MAVIDIRSDITLNWLSSIDTTAEEVFDISIVDLPTNVTINSFLGGTSFHKMSTADVTLSIVGSYTSILIIGSRKIEAIIVTTSYRNGWVRRRSATITVCAQSKFMEPYVAAHVNILGFPSHLRLLSRYELIKNAAKEYERFVLHIIDNATTISTYAFVLIFKLGEIDQCSIGNLKPAFGPEDTHITHIASTIGLLSLGCTRNIQEIKADGGDSQAILMKINQTIVRLIVFVQVNGHQRKLLASIIRRYSTLVEIANQDNGIVIDRRTIELS